MIKPASDTPLTTLYLAEITKDIIPPGVLNVVTGRGTTIGRALCENPEVKLVSMTGSTATGKDIARMCSKTLKRPHLELGGKAPVIVCIDADLDAVAEMLKNAFWNSGQDCGQPCRVIADENIFDELVSKVVKQAESIKVGDTSDPEVLMGPVVNMKRRDEIKAVVNRCIDMGGKIKTGGKCGFDKGAYYLPTVITDVKQDWEIVQEELFGPVITIQSFSTLKQAINMANDSKYGLAASVWTNNISFAMAMSRKLQYGSVWVNAHSVQPHEMPWGGYKESGYGKDCSGYAYEDYTQIKHVGIKYNDL